MNFPDNYRIPGGQSPFQKMYGTPNGSKFGCFFIPYGSNNLLVIAAPEDEQWQHVSVSLKNRCPNWAEMSYVKELFWGDDETVVQFHPKKTEYVNLAENCLHLWRNTMAAHELPPWILVGPKDHMNPEETKEFVDAVKEQMC